MNFKISFPIFKFCMKMFWFPVTDERQEIIPKTEMENVWNLERSKVKLSVYYVQ